MGELDDYAGLVEGAGVPESWRPGRVLMRERETSDGVFFIGVGMVKVLAGAANGRTGVLAWRGLGELIGEQACVDGRPRSATAVVTRAGTGTFLAAPAFKELMHDHPGFAESVLRNMSIRLRESGQDRTDLGTLSVGGRTAAFLARYARRDPRFDEVTGGVVSLTQQELAETVGASRESVIRVLQDFQEAGWLKRGRGRIFVLDAVGLEVRARKG
ncbi:Crp/Fnr family transcriptional regulator [Kitasatospora phosalacinea]|uniref:Crp/Fnr family transcriptional regulator n=1 Tax=Kitasatospora phosalacinea TaxID=2065 RepID=A0A9W6PDA9_9ACTN|nr:Crp/Fnr family transcriptional regulator [Kitasatospora phosalacinea]GLW52868.1 Crp/Fnr family transcriptional regulator [Kitasatospora phosalacinea]